LFDEADVKEAGYAFELNNFRAFDKAKREFGMIEASATFPDLPSSKKLDGTVTDYWVTSFEGFETTVDKEFGKKKNLLVFYKDFEKEVTPALAVLKKRGIKFIILNKDMKDYAKQIYASQTGPFLCFLDINIYAAGFDFGDHDAFIIGQHGNNVYLQARGRIGRRTGYVGNVLTTVEGMESAARPIKENEDSDAVKAVFEAMKASAKADKKAEAQDKLNKLVARYNKTEVPQMDPKEGKTNFYRILVKSLEQSFSNYKNLFAILPSEKGKRLPGEFIIKSGLLQFADEKEELTNNILPIIIEIAYCKRICEIAKSYEGDDG
jgi:hypothetical protein